jgi:hypothetical protein
MRKSRFVEGFLRVIEASTISAVALVTLTSSCGKAVTVRAN